MPFPTLVRSVPSTGEVPRILPSPGLLTRTPMAMCAYQMPRAPRGPKPFLRPQVLTDPLLWSRKTGLPPLSPFMRKVPARKTCARPSSLPKSLPTYPPDQHEGHTTINLRHNEE
jgi:hypothetical protein